VVRLAEDILGTDWDSDLQSRDLHVESHYTLLMGSQTLKLAGLSKL